jgi:hypothetical protein
LDGQSCNGKIASTLVTQFPKIEHVSVVPGFSFNFVISQTGNHPKENLARFGYITDMKLEILIILLYFIYFQFEK